MRDSIATKVHVLVVEDTEDHSDLLRRYFERAGCVVTTVATAERAIVSYLSETPDLAVIDLQLPGMDGWQLATLLKIDRPGCAIMITSVLDAADFPVADAILPKPFTGADVRRALQSAVPGWTAA